MTDDTENAEEKAQWQKTGGFAADTERVTFTVTEDLLAEWEDEAEDQGFDNRSDYFRTLIAEARAYRNNDVRDPSTAEQRIQQLQTEVERLEQKLAQEQQQGSGRVSFDDPRFITQFLSENYQPLSEILQAIVESGALNDLVRQPVEDQLYYLAQEGEVAYERGWGWKLTNDGNGGGER